jgi:predicted nucleic acid-binding protein
MYTTDTHALLWHLQQRFTPRVRRQGRGLSPRARRIFTAADEGRETVLIPTIVLVELVYLSERGIVPGQLVDALLTDLGRGAENYQVVPLGLEIVHHLRDIPARSVPEMPDRIIAATAKATRSRLLSRDEALSRVASLQVVW